MAEFTKIEWATHTFNPWVGCTKVSPACDHCYAESWAKRSGSPELWKGERRKTTQANWSKVVRWNDAAKSAGERHRVFCASLADVFDNQVPDEWRANLWSLIAQCDALDWLLLTKRPQNIAKMLPSAVHQMIRPWPWPNVWLGTTAEDRAHYDARWRHLSAVPAVVHFISYEPALGPLRLSNEKNPDWIICGGESGHHARTMVPEWARDLRDDCATFGIAFFMKQMTSKAPIPPDLLVRQFPLASVTTRAT